MVITGIYYALASVAAGLLVSWFAGTLGGIPFYIFAAFSLYFFRDPERAIPQGPYAVSPADGKVVVIEREPDNHQRIAIFLSPLDVHVNRTPIAGRVTEVDYKPGKFLVATKKEASFENEQNIVTVDGADGTRVVFSQIAGLVARRIIFNKKVGDQLQTGDRIGHIQFGSRMDVVLGPEWEIVSQIGDRVQAGASILARRKPQ